MYHKKYINRQNQKPKRDKCEKTPKHEKKGQTFVNEKNCQFLENWGIVCELGLFLFFILNSITFEILLLSQI